MKIKCKVEADGSVYLAAINDGGEHRQSATLGPNQEIEVDLNDVAEGQVEFGQVADAEGDEQPAQPDGGTPEAEAPPETLKETVELPAGLTITRAVVYRSKTGKYDLPAVVTATVATLDPEGVRLGHVPPLSTPEHVHLTVFTCGKQGTSRDGNPVNNEAAGGSYQEFDIPQFVAVETGSDEEAADPAPGSWRWPERV